MRICFVTHGRAPALTRDDRQAADACRARGLAVAAGAWDDPSVDWAGFDQVVLRSTWNYHLVPDLFDAWLDRLSALGVTVWNPVPVLRWNAGKTYLTALGEVGVPVVPTRVLAPGAVPAPDRWAADFGTPEAVMKPAVGASAHGVLRIRLDEPGIRDRLQEAAVDGPVLVQPFEVGVQERGEWSAIFLAGRYSHAVLKRPAAGDFRVQEELGGRACPGRLPRPSGSSVGRPWPRRRAIPSTPVSTRSRGRRGRA